MPIHSIDIEKLIQHESEYLIIDVRSPAEYEHAHIPNAVSIPIFSNEERKEIGTAYKKQSREVAVNIGLNYFSERMKQIPTEIHDLLKQNKEKGLEKKLLVHCWRGGMRSQTVAWLMSLYGHSVDVLDGGYKKYRHWVLSQFEKTYPINILGGYTGSGKTELLQELKKNGECVIDLESLASHKGSAFGALGMGVQPTQEMFENQLAMELNECSQAKEIWLEDESRRIGRLSIPSSFWNQMHASDLYFLEIPSAERNQFLLKYYGRFSVESLEESILRLEKRLGGKDTQDAIRYLKEGDRKSCFEILLKYYDKTYNKGFESHNFDELKVTRIPCSKVGTENIEQLLSFSNK